MPQVAGPAAGIVLTTVEPFSNEPILELRRASVRAGLADALAAHDGRGPLRVPVWIGDDRRDGGDIVSTDPGKPGRVVAEAAAATPSDVDQALSTARPWGAPAAERADPLPARRRRTARRTPQGTPVEPSPHAFTS
jgi:hypothetical protein